MTLATLARDDLRSLRETAKLGMSSGIEFRSL